MKKKLLVIGLLGYWVIGLSGCVVRTYPVTKDRIDQDLSAGNRGYLAGEVPPSPEVKERRATRTTQAVEVELHSPIKFEKMPKRKPVQATGLSKTEDEAIWGNRGFITQGYTSKISEPVSGMAAKAVNIERYTVQKGDTLQRISKKFYGTSKKWAKIYQANKNTLKAPDKIYPGQVINIPVEPLKETTENLK